MKRVECHVIAGLGGWFFSGGTRNLDKLFDKLSDVWDSTHWWHRSWEQCADGIIARRNRYKDHPVVILIGHSYGALRCQKIASRLAAHGITVHYIAGIDPTALPWNHPPMRIPSNVKEVDEFHATSGWPKWARRRDPSGLRGGKYIYPPRWPGHKLVRIIPGGHVACASNLRVVNAILAKVKALVVS